MSNHFTHGYALLIGVGTTAESRYSLPVTVKDVQALKTVLTDPNLCAYMDDSEHIRLLQNEQTTHSAILDGLTWLKEKAAADGDATIVVFYSGHGCFDLSSQSYYLLQHDFNSTDIANTALSAQEFTQALRQIQAKRLWVVIDSCHAEGMATSKGELPADFIATALPKGVVDALKQGEGRASYYKQALAIGEKLGNKANQAACCSSLGLLALDRDRPTEARPWYERELALAQEVGRQSLVADAQGGLARVLEKEERYAEALPLALAALEIRERLREEGLDFSRQLVERLRCKAEME